MKVLLSIKPEYALKIFDGKKKFEYRKSLFKRSDIDTVIVYATKPIGKIIGEFEIGEIIEDTPVELWNLTKTFSGIKKKDYMNYFNDREKAFAITIKATNQYDNPMELSELNQNIKVPPQSFRYIVEG
ncbi:MAG: ASCH domain-containing protein [Clostridiales bacterium]|nr:ASCH domain-containing protein [Clostridiales bacterium]